MDTTVLNAVCIGFVWFVMLQVCLAMPLDDIPNELMEYEPTDKDTDYTEACVFCFAFQHQEACELCNANLPEPEVDELMSKRSGPAYYHPFLRGGYPKKSYFYNPLLRGSSYKKSFSPKPRIYHPFLRGGFGKYNPPSLYP